MPGKHEFGDRSGRYPLRKIVAAIALVSLSSVWVGSTSMVQHAKPPNQNIVEYNVSLEPDLTRAWVQGQETILFDPRSTPDGELVFTANTLRIRDVTVDGIKTEVRVQEQALRIPVPIKKRHNGSAVLKLSFEGAPERGYDAKDGFVVTSYFACSWMICAQDAFGDKAQFALDLVLPKKMTTVGPGGLADSGTLPNGKFHALWKTDRPYSSYLYAFAAGDFKTATRALRHVELRFVAAASSETDLKALFEPTADMLAFFEQKSGTAFPHRSYTQLLVDGSAAQEAVSHSIIGRRMIEPRLDDPMEDWVIAHELAHQWWGNAITCTELPEFWLNEGVTNFMVAAWKEHRWGRAAYDRELDLARQRLTAAGAEWRDVPLTFSGPYPSLTVRRAIQYSKGQLFMDALRSELGEKAFWTALSAYTSDYLGHSVTSRDFQSAFERSSGRNLSSLFDAWVY